MEWCDHVFLIVSPKPQRAEETDFLVTATHMPSIYHIDFDPISLSLFFVRYCGHVHAFQIPPIPFHLGPQS